MNQNSAVSVATGFWIRRPAYPIGLRRSRLSHLKNFMSPTDNKENIPPTTARHLARQRKSPLPHWYPRTPLRDITVVVNVSKSFSILNLPCRNIFAFICMHKEHTRQFLQFLFNGRISICNPAFFEPSVYYLHWN